MPLRNQLPSDYQRFLPLVINEKITYAGFSNQVLRELNPAWVTRISSEMQKGYPSGAQLLRGWGLGGHDPFKSTLGERPEMAAVFSVSASGYVREKAVKMWCRVHNAFELALLIMRLNDWVPQIRAAAVSKFEALMRLPVQSSGLTAETVIGCMDLILNTERFGRMGKAEFGILDQLLDMNDLRKELAEHITESDLDSAPRFLKLALKRGILMDDLAIIASQGQHLDVRRIAVDHLLYGMYKRSFAGDMQRVPLELDVDRAEIARSALADPSPAVRCIALSFIAEFKPAPLYNEETFRAFVMDKRFPIVERAIYGLRSLNIDYVEEVRQRILGGDLSIRSIEVLGRFGDVSDGDLIFDRIETVEKAHKIRALGAAARLGNSASKQILGRLLFETDDITEARIIASKLYASDYSPNIEAIVRAVQSGRDLVARGCLRLISRLSTMALALAISELIVAGIEFEEASLWELLEKKRNTGMFAPSENAVNSLRRSVRTSPVLQKEFSKVLGLKLFPAPN